MTKIAVMVGSLRKDSLSKKIARNVMELFPDEYELEFIDIGNLPLYNQDYDEQHEVPDAYTTFRSQIKHTDAILFVTPEYNRSVPGVLKNAIDVGSRPKETSVWNHKPAGIISVSPSRLSAFGANHHLRQSLVFFNMPIVQQPEMYIGNALDVLDGNGKIYNVDTLELLQKFANAFVDLINKQQ